VVFFPAGSYRFRSDIRLLNGVILRGAEPAGATSARDEKFSPPSRIEFPKYTPTFTGSGAPVDAAFKGIVLAEPATAANCGVVHLALNRGCVTLAEADGHRCGANRFVFGCVLRNAAGVMTEVPNAQQNQPAWLRYTHKFRPAIRVHASENALVANNHLPKSDYDIYVAAPRHKKPGDFPIRRVTVVKNVTHTNGIRVMGWPTEYVAPGVRIWSIQVIGPFPSSWNNSVAGWTASRRTHPRLRLPTRDLVASVIVIQSLQSDMPYKGW
jgi:hypothetical protein